MQNQENKEATEETRERLKKIFSDNLDRIRTIDPNKLINLSRKMRLIGGGNQNKYLVIANQLIEEFKNLRYDPQSSSFIIFDEETNLWRYLTKGKASAIENNLDSILAKILLSSPAWSEFSKPDMLKGIILNLEAQFERMLLLNLNDPAYLPCNNGVYEFETGNFYPYEDIKYDPHFNFTWKLDINYNAEKKDYSFIGGLINSIFTTDKKLDEESVTNFKLLLGLIIRPNYHKVTKIFTFYGMGSNGKSTLGQIICALIPEEFISSLSTEDLTNPSHHFRTIALENKKVNISADDTGKFSENSDFLKAAVDWERVTLEGKYLQPKSVILKMVFIRCTNKIARSGDNSRGYARRQLYFDLQNSFYNSSEWQNLLKDKIENQLHNENKYLADPTMGEQIKQFQTELLNYAIEQERILRIKFNYHFIESVTNQYVKNKLQRDEPEFEFIDQMLKFCDGPNHWCFTVNEIYDLYSGYYRSSHGGNINNISSKESFCKKIKEMSDNKYQNKVMNISGKSTRVTNLCLKKSSEPDIETNWNKIKNAIERINGNFDIPQKFGEEITEPKIIDSTNLEDNQLVF